MHRLFLRVWKSLQFWIFISKRNKLAPLVSPPGEKIRLSVRKIPGKDCYPGIGQNWHSDCNSLDCERANKLTPLGLIPPSQELPAHLA
jgi:hypothetical protein